MTIAAPPPGLQPEDYEEIEAAVMETARGRWFLAEFARRVRSAENARLLAAIERLESRLEAQQALAPAEAFTLADRLTDLSWSLRERGVEDFVCGKFEALAREFKGAGARRAPQAAETAVPPEPPAAPSAPTQAEISLHAPPGVAPERAAAATPTPEQPAIDPRLAPLSWLDSLPLVDRLALFA